MAAVSSISDVVLFILDVLEREYHITDHSELKSLVYLIAKHKNGANSLARTFSKWNIKTDEDLEHVIAVYEMMVQLYPDSSVGRDRIRDLWYESIRSTVEERRSNDVINLIVDTIINQGITDRYGIFEQVCASLEARFCTEEDMDSYLSSLQLGSTKQMLRAIDSCLANSMAS